MNENGYPDHTSTPEQVLAWAAKEISIVTDFYVDPEYASLGEVVQMCHCLRNNAEDISNDIIEWLVRNRPATTPPGK